MIHHMYSSTLLVYFRKSYHINAQISIIHQMQYCHCQ